MSLNKPCSALFMHYNEFQSLMASDPLGIERKEQKKDGTAHSTTYQRLLYLCKLKNYLIEWQILKKSSGIRAELWFMKPLSASPAKQMHKKHYYNCVLYTQGPLGPKLAQTDWLWAKQEVPHNLCAECSMLEPITPVKMHNLHSWSQWLLLHWFL